MLNGILHILYTVIYFKRLTKSFDFWLSEDVSELSSSVKITRNILIVLSINKFNKLPGRTVPYCGFSSTRDFPEWIFPQP